MLWSVLRAVGNLIGAFFLDALTFCAASNCEAPKGPDDSQVPAWRQSDNVNSIQLRQDAIPMSDSQGPSIEPDTVPEGAYGVLGAGVTQLDQLHDAVAAALAHDGPSLVEVVSDPLLM